MKRWVGYEKLDGDEEVGGDNKFGGSEKMGGDETSCGISNQRKIPDDCMPHF